MKISTLFVLTLGIGVTAGIPQPACAGGSCSGNRPSTCHECRCERFKVQEADGSTHYETICSWVQKSGCN